MNAPYTVESLIAELESYNIVHHLSAQVYRQNEACSKALFLKGSFVQDEKPCFVKCYPETVEADAEAKAEYRYAGRFLELVNQKQPRIARTLCPRHLLKLSHGHVLITDFAEGDTLYTRVQTTPLTEAEARTVCEAFREFSELLQATDFIHRDICLKNFLFDGKTLTLIDFQTACPKQDLDIKNPPFNLLKYNLSLGAGYCPSRGVWNDLYSLAHSLERLAPHLPFDTTKDIAALYALASDEHTIRPRYTVDEQWKKTNAQARPQTLPAPPLDL